MLGTEILGISSSDIRRNSFVALELETRDLWKQENLKIYIWEKTDKNLQKKKNKDSFVHNYKILDGTSNSYNLKNTYIIKHTLTS